MLSTILTPREDTAADKVCNNLELPGAACMVDDLDAAAAEHDEHVAAQLATSKNLFTAAATESGVPAFDNNGSPVLHAMGQRTTALSLGIAGGAQRAWDTP